ncbi:phosphoesterase [Lignipirellula cremea]|uniref:Phosphoesterase n=1 Tax=Lignipirellula cremea TaxID=2528010 RepID=A0A518DX02_9BACT|nr:phosphoesterase [Lignipirellula cremea]QDU96360.1 hypothetical protein Pla8534_41800 [Lignipirellula cremea]
MNNHIEQVLVLPAARLQELGYFQGFSSDIDRYLAELLDPAHTSYRPRPEMELDPSFKQLIPYVLFRWTDDQGKVSLFQYTRGSGQGEARLHQKRSVGVGGHISSVDGECDDPYLEGMRRELAEEVEIRTPYIEECVGLINDDETDVGKVHLGVVHILDVASPAVVSREEDLASAGFQALPQLLKEIDQFETWSQIVLKALFT